MASAVAHVVELLDEWLDNQGPVFAGGNSQYMNRCRGKDSGILIHLASLDDALQRFLV